MHPGGAQTPEGDVFDSLDGWYETPSVPGGVRQAGFARETPQASSMLSGSEYGYGNPTLLTFYLLYHPVSWSQGWMLHLEV